MNGSAIKPSSFSELVQTTGTFSNTAMSSCTWPCTKGPPGGGGSVALQRSAEKLRRVLKIGRCGKLERAAQPAWRWARHPHRAFADQRYGQHSCPQLSGRSRPSGTGVHRMRGRPPNSLARPHVQTHRHDGGSRPGCSAPRPA
jgi:hypothetical protein